MGVPEFGGCLQEFGGIDCCATMQVRLLKICKHASTALAWLKASTIKHGDCLPVLLTGQAVVATLAVAMFDGYSIKYAC